MYAVVKFGQAVQSAEGGQLMDVITVHSSKIHAIARAREEFVSLLAAYGKSTNKQHIKDCYVLQDDLYGAEAKFVYTFSSSDEEYGEDLGDTEMAVLVQMCAACK